MSSVPETTPLRDHEAKVTYGPDYVAISFWRAGGKSLDHQLSCPPEHARRFAEAILRAVEKVGT